MECPRRWTTLYIFVNLLLLTVDVFCQSAPSENVNTPSEVNGSSAKAQLMNTLISLASAKGVLPEMASVFQPSLAPENTYTTACQDNRVRTHNVVPIVSQTPVVYQQQTIPANNQPISIYAPVSNEQKGFPTMSFSPPYLSQQPTFVPITTSYGQPQKAQIIPLENYNIAQSPPVVWQIPQIANEMYNWNPPTSIVEEQVTPVEDIQMSPTIPTIPEITTENRVVEVISEQLREVISEPQIFTNMYESGLPLNLHINVPSQNIPAPKITVVSTAPSPAPAKSEPAQLPPSYAFPPPLPPIVMTKSRSSWKNILPIILIALFNDRGCGGGGCPCCCNCNSESPIPVPYPIPIPTNNPIINVSKSSNSSSKQKKQQDNNDDEESDEDGN